MAGSGIPFGPICDMMLEFAITCGIISYFLRYIILIIIIFAQQIIVTMVDTKLDSTQRHENLNRAYKYSTEEMGGFTFRCHKYTLHCP